MSDRLDVYLVPAADAAMVKQLLVLQRCKHWRERKELLGQLAEAGWQVRFVNGYYEASKPPAERYTLPLRKCSGPCGAWKRLDAFISSRGVEHPWCRICRHQHPVEAERARTRLAYALKEHRNVDDLLGIVRCQNPACPPDGLIPSRQVRRGATFCSPACRGAVLNHS